MHVNKLAKSFKKKLKTWGKQKKALKRCWQYYRLCYRSRRRGVSKCK